MRYSLFLLLLTLGLCAGCASEPGEPAGAAAPAEEPRLEGPATEAFRDAAEQLVKNLEQAVAKGRFELAEGAKLRVDSSVLGLRDRRGILPSGTPRECQRILKELIEASEILMFHVLGEGGSPDAIVRGELFAERFDIGDGKIEAVYRAELEAEDPSKRKVCEAEGSRVIPEGSAE